MSASYAIAAGITWFDVENAVRGLGFSSRSKVDPEALFRALHRLAHGTECTCDPVVTDRVGWKRWATFAGRPLQKGLRRQARRHATGRDGSEPFSFDFASMRVSASHEVGDVALDANHAETYECEHGSSSGEEMRVVASLLIMSRSE